MSDHHNSYEDTSPAYGKNAAFFARLRENPTWGMSEWLRTHPFLALSPSHKAAILAFLCNELLQNKAVIRQIEVAIETVGQHRRDRYVLDNKIRKLRVLHSRKVRMAQLQNTAKPEAHVNEESKEVHEAANNADAASARSSTPDTSVNAASVNAATNSNAHAKDHEDDEDDAEGGDSCNESEGTLPEEEEDLRLGVDELARKLERLTKQAEANLQALSSSTYQMRATPLGQDRYHRRYWALARAGGVLVEAVESADPDLAQQLSLERKQQEQGVEGSGDEGSESGDEPGTLPSEDEEEDEELASLAKKSEDQEEAKLDPPVEQEKTEPEVKMEVDGEAGVKTEEPEAEVKMEVEPKEEVQAEVKEEVKEDKDVEVKAEAEEAVEQPVKSEEKPVNIEADAVNSKEEKLPSQVSKARRKVLVLLFVY